jgi:hypothetical protein
MGSLNQKGAPDENVTTITIKKSIHLTVAELNRLVQWQ